MKESAGTHGTATQGEAGHHRSTTMHGIGCLFLATTKKQTSLGLNSKIPPPPLCCVR